MDPQKVPKSLVRFIKQTEKELSVLLDAIVSSETLSKLGFVRGPALPTYLDYDPESTDAGIAEPLFFEPYPNDDLLIFVGSLANRLRDGDSDTVICCNKVHHRLSCATWVYKWYHEMIFEAEYPRHAGWAAIQR